MRTIALLFSLAGVVAAADSPDSVLPRVAARAERFGSISRQIWETPELGFHENKSSALLQQELRANGFDSVLVKPLSFEDVRRLCVELGHLHITELRTDQTVGTPLRVHD